MIYLAHAVGSAALATECAERRLAAILAADVPGYSRLGGADEEGTLAQLKVRAPRKAHATPGSRCAGCAGWRTDRSSDQFPDGRHAFHAL